MSNWYRVYGYGDRLFSARELMELPLKDSSLVKQTGDAYWRRYSDKEFQYQLSQDLGYTVDQDGTIHRIVHHSDFKPKQESSSSPNSVMGYTVDQDGTIHKTVHNSDFKSKQESSSSSNNVTDSNSNCLGRIIAVVLPFIVFFGLGGISREIYFWVNPLNQNSTINDIYNGEITAQAILVGIYLLISECIYRDDPMGMMFVLFGVVIVAELLPMSITVVVATSIIEICLMLYSGYKAATK